ncbi:MAG: DEAD/DEAH box helicase [Reichenbachiella sp.]
MKFSDYRISPEIKHNLEQQEIKRPTDIQFKSIPAIMNGEDVLAIAQTGTGKTAAFAIPIIHKIQTKKWKKGNGPSCIIMVPTRELAMQINKAFDSFAKGTKVKTLSIFGGVGQDEQISRLKNKVDIIVATPGRMFDLASQGYLKLDNIDTLVLDEADHMLDLGFITDIRDLIQKLPKKRQSLFFSATIDEKIKKLAYSIVNNPIRIQISPKDPVSKNIEHTMAFIEMDDKRFFLERLIGENPDKKLIVFVRTKVRAERVKLAMARVDIASDTIHGDREQSDRSATMSNFRSGKLKVLIATDISARGIDIPNVDFVVNYDLPDEPESYVHRVGRTGRANNRGYATSFCSTEEKPLLAEIEQYITKSIKELEIERDAYKDTVDLSNEANHDWKRLMNDAREEESKRPKKKNKKR